MRYVNSITAMLALFASAAAAAGDAQQDHLARVERGLRGPASFVGDPTWTLAERMAHYGVPGLSLAIIEDGRVVATRAYGIADRRSGKPMREDTLLQAASISKPVSAFGAMHLVDRGALALDAPVATQLKSWRIPENEFARAVPITLAQLLSHTGGFGVHGFLGYERGAPLPSLTHILDGQPPANSQAVRVEQQPGAAFRYSGGGYTIAQLTVSDAARQPFVEFMQRSILKPIGMRDSSFVYPLPARRLKRAAAGVLPNGQDVVGGSKVHPESAAAGLWTTARDLARFAIEVQRALHGESRLLKPGTAERMLRDPGPDHYALGFAITHQNGAPYFGHEGWNDGFSSALVANREGQGVAIMINANQPQLLQEVRRAVAFEYGWPGYRGQELQREATTAEQLRDLPGRYRYDREQFIVIRRDGDRLRFGYGGEQDYPLTHVGQGRFVREDTGLTLALRGDAERGELAFVHDDGRRDVQARLGAQEHALRERLYADDASVDADYRKLVESGEIFGSEAYLNNQGYRLVGMQRYPQAIQLFALVTRLYPQSANAWDSLGEATLLGGDRDGARRYYQHALALDPGLESAKTALAKLASP